MFRRVRRHAPPSSRLPVNCITLPNALFSVPPRLGFLRARMFRLNLLANPGPVLGLRLSLIELLPLAVSPSAGRLVASTNHSCLPVNPSLPPLSDGRSWRTWSFRWAGRDRPVLPRSKRLVLNESLIETGGWGGSEREVSVLCHAPSVQAIYS